MNTLKLDVKSLEIDNNEELIGSFENSRYFEFNETFSTKIQLETNSGYKSIAFSQITSPFCIIVIADNLINAKINNVEFTNTKFIVLNTNISSVEVANADLETATAQIFLWGKQ